MNHWVKIRKESWITKDKWFRFHPPKYSNIGKVILLCTVTLDFAAICLLWWEAPPPHPLCSPMNVKLIWSEAFLLFQGLIRHFRPLLESRMADYAARQQDKESSAA